MVKMVLSWLMCSFLLFCSSSGWGKDVAVLRLKSYYASNLAYSGVLAGLATNGYVEGDRLSIVNFDAEGDPQRLVALAEEIAAGNFDLIVTLSTAALEAMAHANLETKIPHVFTFVSTPSVVDVGVTEDGIHPDHITGLYHPNPVPSAFRLAREMDPSLAKVGLVWSPIEKNSAYQTDMAREICLALNIELIERTVSSADEVLAMAQDLSDQQVEAFFMNGDNVVLSAIQDIVQTARIARIPVFFVGSGGIDEGTLFDLGTDYEQSSFIAGEMGAAILDGQSPADIPVVRYTTESLFLNLNALVDLKDPWTVTDQMKLRAERIIGETSNVPAWEEIQ